MTVAGTGAYHSYLCNEVLPWVDARCRTLADRESRAISGKSSGGFGAMITPMLRPDVFGSLATHAGDANYELSDLAELGKAARFLREYNHDISRWWHDFGSRTAFANEADHTNLHDDRSRSRGPSAHGREPSFRATHGFWSLGGTAALLAAS